MPKVIIQIPCYNEEQTLGVTLSALPRELPGVDKVEWLVIDDGSADRTVEVARAYGVDHIISLPHNRGLATAFMAGLQACIERQADIIVNTDADNQYCADDIPVLIKPILEGKAEIVIGARPISSIQHFSPLKKLLQQFGSWVVRLASRTDVQDAPSGFRAMTRAAAMQLNVFNTYTYTLETIIQAGRKNMVIVSVPIRTNPGELRSSRLVKSIPSYLRRSIFTIFRIFVAYEPLKFFWSLGLVVFSLGTLIGIRFLYFFIQGNGEGHVQSLILAALLISMGFLFIMIGIVAELISVNRKLLEKVDARIYHFQEMNRELLLRQDTPSLTRNQTPKANREDLT